RQTSIDNEDIQKNRWGGRSTGFGRRLFIANIEHERYNRKKYFVFDAVLEATDGKPLKGPFYFHLHDSYSPSKIRITKTRSEGTQAILEEIGSEGTYTIGVQFKDAEGRWRSLEYDLSRYRKGSLKKYD